MVRHCEAIPIRDDRVAAVDRAARETGSDDPLTMDLATSIFAVSGDGYTLFCTLVDDGSDFPGQSRGAAFLGVTE